MNQVFQVQKFLQHQGKANAKFLTTNTSVRDNELYLKAL